MSRIPTSLITEDRLLHASTADLVDYLTNGTNAHLLINRLLGDVHALKRAKWQDMRDLVPEADLLEQSKVSVLAELIRRLAASPPRRMVALQSNIEMLLKPYASEQHEYMFVITLDCQLPVPGILNLHQISEGTRNGVVVEPVEIFAPALLDKASAIMLAHTHPNDTATQTMGDIVVTQELLSLAQQMHITIVDHIIVSRQGSFSMMEQGAWLTP